jgi:hypothetical protein
MWISCSFRGRTILREEWQSINDSTRLTYPARLRRDEVSMPCSRAHHCSSTCRTALVRASTRVRFHTPPTEASQGMRRGDRRPQAIRSSSLLRFEGFSLIILLLLQIHFLRGEIKEREKVWLSERSSCCRRACSIPCFPGSSTPETELNPSLSAETLS